MLALIRVPVAARIRSPVEERGVAAERIQQLRPRECRTRVRCEPLSAPPACGRLPHRPPSSGVPPGPSRSGRDSATIGSSQSKARHPPERIIPSHSTATSDPPGRRGSRVRATSCSLFGRRPCRSSREAALRQHAKCDTHHRSARGNTASWSGNHAAHAPHVHLSSATYAAPWVGLAKRAGGGQLGAAASMSVLGMEPYARLFTMRILVGAFGSSFCPVRTRRSGSLVGCEPEP